MKRRILKITGVLALIAGITVMSTTSASANDGNDNEGSYSLTVTDSSGNCSDGVSLSGDFSVGDNGFDHIEAAEAVGEGGFDPVVADTHNGHWSVELPNLNQDGVTYELYVYLYDENGEQAVDPVPVSLTVDCSNDDGGDQCDDQSGDESDCNDNGDCNVVQAGDDESNDNSNCDNQCDESEDQSSDCNDDGDDDECDESEDQSSDCNGEGHTPVTICHSKGNGEYVEITVDDDGSYEGHIHHEGDIIPKPEGGCPVPPSSSSSTSSTSSTTSSTTSTTAPPSSSSSTSSTPSSSAPTTTKPMPHTGSNTSGMLGLGALLTLGGGLMLIIARLRRPQLMA